MNTKILNYIRTITDREKLLAEVDILSKSLYEVPKTGDDSAGVHSDLAAVLKDRIRFWVSEILAVELPGSFEKREKYFKDLKETLEKMEVVSLKIGFEPSESTIDKLSLFLKKNIKKDAIFNLEFEPALLGGAVITYKGKYFDFSLKRVFEAEFEEKKGEIASLIYKS